MALITFADRVQDERTGAAIPSLRVRVYPVNADKSLGASFNEVTGDANGYYTITIDTTVLTSPTGTYAVQLFDSGTGYTRYLHPQISFQAQTIYGVNGVAPVADASVTDTKIGNRTANQALASPANTGTLTQLLSWIAGRIKAITGTTNWYDAPATTLAAAASHIASDHLVAFSGSYVGDGAVTPRTILLGLPVGAVIAGLRIREQSTSNLWSLDNVFGTGNTLSTLLDAGTGDVVSTSAHLGMTTGAGVTPDLVVANGGSAAFGANTTGSTYRYWGLYYV